MNVLVLTSNLPYPPTDGWRIRTYELLKGLSADNRVTLLSFSEEMPTSEALEQLRLLCDSVEVVERNPQYSPYNLARGLVGAIPFSVLNYRSRAMFRKLADVLSHDSYDTVQVEDIHMAQYALHLSGLSKILDMHNIESDLLWRYAAIQRNPFRSLYARLTSAKLRRYESEHSRVFDWVLTCSNEDRDIVAKGFGHPQVAVIQNGVDTDRFTPRPGAEEARTLAFVGRMDYVANEDAVIYFHQEVLPLVWRAIPDARFYVVGKRPSRSIAALAGDPRIIVTGFVDDVRDFLARAAVFVTPLRFGGGTRLKILEAMSMGKAVVSTRAGCEGIATTSNGEIVLADTPEAFASSVIELLLSEERRRALGERARQLVVREYKWSAIHERLRRVYQSLKLSPGRFVSVEG